MVNTGTHSDIFIKGLYILYIIFTIELYNEYK